MNIFMKQILIAVESDSLAQALADALEPSYHVVCSSDSEDALQMLCLLQPDVLVLDMMLPGIDGVNILRASYAAGIYPRVIAVSDFIPRNMLVTLERLNVRAVFRLPMDLNILIAKVFEVAETDGDISTPEQQICNILAVLGFKINTNRYRIVERALYEFARNPYQQLVSQLYPAVGASCGGTGTQVEKAIRDCVKTAWLDRNEIIWRMYFSTDKYGSVKRPTNIEFLTRISKCIQMNDKNVQPSCSACEKIG